MLHSPPVLTSRIQPLIWEIDAFVSRTPVVSTPSRKQWDVSTNSGPSGSSECRLKSRKKWTLEDSRCG